MSLLITDRKKFRLQPVSLFVFVTFVIFKKVDQKKTTFFCSESSGYWSSYTIFSANIIQPKPDQKSERSEMNRLSITPSTMQGRWFFVFHIRPVHFWSFGFLIAKSVSLSEYVIKIKVEFAGHWSQNFNLIQSAYLFLLHFAYFKVIKKIPLFFSSGKSGHWSSYTILSANII